MATVRHKAVLALSLSLVLTASVTAAQDPDAQRTAAARALFAQGMEAVDAGDFETAADRLGRSLELRDSPVVRTNLALALIELGRFVEASENLRRVLHDTEDGSQAHAVAAERLAEVEGHIGQLTIEVSGARRGVEVLLDGQPLASAQIGVPQPADPGSHRVSLERLDREIAAASVTVEAGRRSEVSLLAPVPTPEEAAALDAPPPGTLPLRDEAPGVEEQWWFWTILAVLVIGAGVGVGVGVWAATQPPEPWLEGYNSITFTLGEVP